MDLLYTRPPVTVRRPLCRRARAPVRRACVLWLVFPFLLTPAVARAQQLPIKTYTTADGLPHNSINRIVKDSRGFLWFCTREGLSRFDSYSFTNFGVAEGLVNSSVNDLLETRGGEYWVATDGGLMRFDPRGTAPTRVETRQTSSARPALFTVVAIAGDGERSRAVTALREGRDGTIWAGTDDGLYRMERASRGLELHAIEVGIPAGNREQRTVADLLEDDGGSLWIATPSGLFRRWPDGSAAHYNARSGLPNEYVQDLLENPGGGLWVGTRLGGFFQLAADASHRAPVVAAAFTVPELPTPWVFQLFKTSDHRFWIATARGLVELLPDARNAGGHFRVYSMRNGLSYNEITALAEDDGGSLWLGTNNAGAMKLALNGFTSYGERDGLLQVSALFNDYAGNLCFRGNVLGDRRASVFEGGRLDLVSTEEPAVYHRVGCFDGERFDGFLPAALKPLEWGWIGEGLTLQTRRREWWLGAGVGLFWFKPADRLDALRTLLPTVHYTPRDGLATWQIFRLFEDSRGDVWVSTVGAETNGLARWDHGSARLIDLSGVPGLPVLKDALPRAFGEDAAGNVWIGFDGMLARYRAGAFEQFTLRQGVPPGAIRGIFRDHAGRLWLASAQSGLIRVDNAEGDRPAFTVYSTPQGLSSSDVEAITEDLEGRVYAAGGRGVDRLAPATGHVKHFTTADGLVSGRFRAAFRDRTGVLWFGSSNGLTRVVPAPERVAAPPPVLINAVRVNGIPAHVSALGEQDISLGNFAASQNQLQIDFVGLGFGSGDVLRYQYRLEGADDDWNPVSRQRTVTYAGLGPGGYAFVVRAVNSDDVVSARPAAVRFAILRPFWQRGWFVAVAVLTLGLIVYALHRYRLARLLDMANMRTRIATDLHDDIGANLTRIALLSQVATQTSMGLAATSALPHAAPDIAAVNVPLASIARIARESVGAMSDIVWAINPARETLLDLTRRMRQHADEVFTLRNIELRFDAPDTRPDLRLGVDVRRDVLLIFKECVNNAARHSGCTRVRIEFRVERSGLVLTVADNGGGFDTSLDSEGQGLMSMKRRARRLHGGFDLRSQIDLGTTMTLTIPL